MKRLSFALLAVVSLGCSSGTPNSLTLLTDVASSQKCPNGGVRIDTGADANKNGSLEPSEVGQSVEVCNGAAGGTGPAGGDGTSGDAGASGFSSLVKTTLLNRGDANCPDGGVQLDFGLDDGTGGGTAHNGTLEQGEILSTRYVCSGPQRFFPGSTTPPTSPAGQFTINANGGAGTVNGSGQGGDITIESAFGTRGGHVKVFKTGLADAAFTVAANPAFVAGATPMTITTDTTLVSYGTIVLGAASGDAYFQVANDQNLYATVASAGVPVTSLTVAAGAKLSFAGNFGETVEVTVPRDIKNAGTLTTGVLEDGSSMATLLLSASNYYGDPGSKIDLRGADSNSVGGNGGGLDLEVGGHLVQQGTLLTGGGNGDTGAGIGSSVYLYADIGGLTNTGLIDSRGGNATSSAGGLGGPITARTGYRILRNSGALQSSGGNGAIVGGNAGSIDIGVDGIGEVRNTGDLTAHGGACSATDCQGGNGGAVTIFGHGADLRTSGNLDASGANGQGTLFGGTGNFVNIRLDGNNTNYGAGLDVAAGSIFVSGNLSANGGSGATGQTAGSVQIRLSVESLPQGQEVTLLGYTSINSNGGTGTNVNGGAGGTVSVISTNDSEGGYSESGGAAINYADVVAHGGDGRVGGRGGTLYVQTQTEHIEQNPWEYAANFAATVDLHGGQGSTGNGGSGGELNLQGNTRAENHAAVNAKGGNASSNPLIYSGAGGQVTIYSGAGAVTNTGALELSSGTSSDRADDAGALTMRGTSADNSGAVTANGGNATNYGGAGGSIELTSTPSGASTNTGAISVNGGTGSIMAGAKGYLWLDGVDVTP